MKQSDYSGKPIRSLQTMLNTISLCQSGHTAVAQDGVYGSRTAAAVSEFQRQSGLPATGITDQKTWEAIVSAYDEAEISIHDPAPLELPWQGNTCFYPGDTHHILYLAQSILKCIAEKFCCIPCPELCGALDETTAASIRSFQESCGITVTGNLDKKTWKHLALLYPLALQCSLNENMN